MQSVRVPRSPAKMSIFKRFKRLTASWMRWLHIYASMFGLAVTLFFSVTGITLNHPDWFSETETTDTVQGEMQIDWVRYNPPSNKTTEEDSDPPDDLAGVAKLEVVEFLRLQHKVRVALSQFSGDDRECLVAFKGPGYAADAVIQRDTGKYQLTQNYYGLVAVLNDLHKGRDSGAGWSLLIDISAGLLCFISLTGLGLIFFLRMRRSLGLAIATIGLLVSVAVYVWLVP